MVEGLGKVRCRRGSDGRPRWYIDFGWRGKLYSARGTGFKDRAMAEHFLASIRVQIAEGMSADRAIERLMPEASRAHRVDRWLARWLEIMRERTAMGERSPNYLRELERWSKPDGHFAWWQGKSIYEIRAGALEDWSHWLARRGISAKTRRNVLGGFRSFVGWLKRRELLETVPSFPEVPVDEYAPTLISGRVQDEILAEIPWDRRGAFLAARLGIRPGEIRAADVTDYRIVENVPGLTISRAVKGPNANAPTRGTKGRSAAWIPVDEALQHWIEWRLVQVSKEAMLRGRIALFPNPSARNPERRWIANALREEWNRAAETDDPAHAAPRRRPLDGALREARGPGPGGRDPTEAAAPGAPKCGSRAIPGLQTPRIQMESGGADGTRTREVRDTPRNREGVSQRLAARDATRRLTRFEAKASGSVLEMTAA
ncbi:MAG: hypothetical protein ACYTGV_20200 [Planctomycetota bacterium]